MPRYCDDNKSVMKQKFICLVRMLVYQVCNCNLYFLFRIGSKNKTSSTFFFISLFLAKNEKESKKGERERKRHERKKGDNSMKKSWKEQKDFLVNLSSLFQETKKRKQKLFDFVPGIVLDYSSRWLFTPLLGDCSLSSRWLFTLFLVIVVQMPSQNRWFHHRDSNLNGNLKPYCYCSSVVWVKRRRGREREKKRRRERERERQKREGEREKWQKKKREHWKMWGITMECISRPSHRQLLCHHFPSSLPFFNLSILTLSSSHSSASLPFTFVQENLIKTSNVTNMIC